MRRQFDITRCVWDMDYRRMVAALFSAEPLPAGRTANQNRPDTPPPAH